MREFTAEVLAVFFGFEIIARQAPIGDGIHYAMN